MTSRVVRLPLRIAALALAAIALTGCGPALADPAPAPTHLSLDVIDVAGTQRNGVEYLTGADALTVAVRAMRGGGPVVVMGDYERAADDENGIPAGSIRLDFRGTSSAYTATIVADGIAHHIRVEGRSAAVLTGAESEWTCVAADSATIRRWAPLLDPAELAKALLGDGSGLAVSPPRGTPATVELLLGATEGASGAITISAEGAALPSRLVVADGTSLAEFSYSDWGVDAEVELPNDCAS